MDESTRLQVLTDIKRYEELGEFDRHTDPVDMSLALPVDENFPYIPKGFTRIKYFLQRVFIVYPFRKKMNREILKTQFFGRENLADVPSGIITCNHVNKFDCLAVGQAAKGHRVYTVGAPFNNMKGFMGDMMRAGGLLPLSENLSAGKSFNRAVAHYLKTGNYVAVYPEQSMWWNYEKPRPFKDGAFTLAVINKVPVIPMFITFRHSGEYDDNGIEKKYMSVHIMKPIYPRDDLTRHQNIAYMRDENYRMCCDKYREVYGTPLTYTTRSGNTAEE